MPVILIRCPCGREFVTNETLVGTWLRCPNCGQMTLITWPERRAEAPRPEDELPDEEPLFETPPSPQALKEIAQADRQRPPQGLLTRCVRCGGELREGRLAAVLARFSLLNRLSGRGAAQRRPRSPFCPRCRRAIRRGKQRAAGEDQAAKRPRAAAVHLPFAAKVAALNVLFGAVAGHTAHLAVEGEEPLMAAVAILAALVPLVTLLALVIYLAGSWARVKDIGFGPAAHAAILALGVQLVLAVPGYFAVVTVLNAEGWGTAQPVALAAGAVIWLAGAAAIGRALHARLLPAVALAVAASFVLVLAGLVLEPLGRVAAGGLPRYLIPSSRPTPATGAGQGQPTQVAVPSAPPRGRYPRPREVLAPFADLAGKARKRRCERGRGPAGARAGTAASPAAMARARPSRAWPA